MRRVIWRGLRANWGRFVLTLLAVTLGVAFLSGTLALRSVLASSFEATLGSFNTYPLYVQGPKVDSASGGGSGATERYGPVTRETIEKLRGVDGVGIADPVYSASVPILGPDKQPLKMAGSSIVLLGWNKGATTWPKISQGKAPAGRDQMGLEASAAERLSLGVGDKVYVVSGADLKPLTVTGIFRYESPMALVAVGLVDPETARGLLGNPATVANVGVVPAKGHTQAQVTQAITDALGDTVTVRTQKEVTDAGNEQITTSLGFVNTFLLVFVAIAFFVGIFIITNTFRMSVRAEQRQFATLRALGATAGQVFGVVAFQGVIIGFVGSLLGVPLGAGLVAGLATLLESRFGVPLGEVAMPATVVVISLVVGILVTVLGALLPAREAALTPPVEAMRATQAREKPLLVRALLGAGTTALGVAAVLVVVSDDTPSGVLLGAGVAALVLGVLLLGPVLAHPVMTVLAWPLRIVRPLGRLALRNALANPRRSAATSAALMVGVMLVTAGSVVAATVRASTADVVDSQLRSDVIVTTISEGIPDSVVTKIRGVDGVGEVGGGFLTTRAQVAPKGKDPHPSLVGTLPKDYAHFVDVPVTDGLLARFGAQPSSSVLVSKSEAEKEGLSPGSVVDVAGASGKRRLTVRAIIDSQIVGAPYVVAPRTLTELGLPDGQTMSLLVNAKAGTSVAELKRALSRELEPLHTYQVLDRDEFKGQLASQVDTVLGILYALLGLSIIIAVLGIINTLSLSISERLREIALLRAVGMSRTGVAVMVVMESILISLLGAVLGLLLGTFAAYGLCSYLKDQGLSDMVVPWGSLVGLAVAAAVIGTLAAIAPAIKAVRYKLLDAIARQ